jgi:hypothetical protein
MEAAATHLADKIGVKRQSNGPQSYAYIRAQARVDAEVLRVDKNSRNSLAVRLEAHGYDADAVNANAFFQGLESLTVIEKFLASARQQVAAMVRE